jgi:hypothetical protein
VARVARYRRSMKIAAIVLLALAMLALAAFFAVRFLTLD